MNIHSKPRWRIPESGVTPESRYWNRRKFLQQAGLSMGGALLSGSLLHGATAGFPSTPNRQYTGDDLELEITGYDDITGYNNFYEFSFEKREPRDLANQGWQTEPWTLEIGGRVRNPLKVNVNDLVQRMEIEQRVYRFRCVEAWSMVVPWDGFPLHKLIAMADPKNDAQYVQFTSALDRKHMQGVRKNPHYPWPYTEGLRMDEAMHPLTFLATGIYGKPIPNQNGAPIRLVVPWKYGFKSIKSIVRIDFVKRQPETLWNQLAPREYGFYANVNPEVDHPRWSQADERVIGSGILFSKRVPTPMFNGYEEEVAGLYQGMNLEKYF